MRDRRRHCSSAAKCGPAFSHHRRLTAFEIDWGAATLSRRQAGAFYGARCEIAAGIVQAQQSAAPHFPTTEDLRHLKSIGGPQLSPDGKQALFTVLDATADGAKAHVWVVATSGSEKARQ